MHTSLCSRRTSWLSILSLFAVALLVRSPTASAEMLTYNYVGGLLTYSSPELHPGQYGPRMQGTLTLDSSLVPTGFTGTLTDGFTITLGTDSFGFYGGFCDTGGCPATRFVTFDNGTIVDWALGVMAPLFTPSPIFLTSYGTPLCEGFQCDRFQPVSANGFYDSAKSTTRGTWTLQSAPSPVPLPAPLALLIAGISSLFGARRLASPAA